MRGVSFVEKPQKVKSDKVVYEKAGLSSKEMACYFGCSKEYLSNKLHRDSFSIDDLIIAAFASDYVITFIKKDENEAQIEIDAIDFFTGYDDETAERIMSLKKNKRQKKKEEYILKKAELERMKAEYGFED